jgi:hypothetical protein
VSLGEGLECTTVPSDAQEPARGVLPIRLVTTWVQIIGLPLGGRRGDWSPPRDPLVTLPGVQPGLSGLGSGAKVYETPLGIRKVELFLGNSHNQG